MSFEPRRANALELLRATGMWPSNYEPPILRVFYGRRKHSLPEWPSLDGGLVRK